MQDKREGNFFVECEILMIRYDKLCRILKCGDLSDIATYLPDEEDKRDGGEP